MENPGSGKESRLDDKTLKKKEGKTGSGDVPKP